MQIKIDGAFEKHVKESHEIWCKENKAIVPVWVKSIVTQAVKQVLMKQKSDEIERSLADAKKEG
jgi:hypothetical protein